jgi:hypothetical protein
MYVYMFMMCYNLKIMVICRCLRLCLLNLICYECGYFTRGYPFTLPDNGYWKKLDPLMGMGTDNG